MLASKTNSIYRVNFVKSITCVICVSFRFFLPPIVEIFWSFVVRPQLVFAFGLESCFWAMSCLCWPSLGPPPFAQKNCWNIFASLPDRLCVRSDTTFFYLSDVCLARTDDRTAKPNEEAYYFFRISFKMAALEHPCDQKTLSRRTVACKFVLTF